MNLFSCRICKRKQQDRPLYISADRTSIRYSDKHYGHKYKHKPRQQQPTDDKHLKSDRWMLDKRTMVHFSQGVRRVFLCANSSALYAIRRTYQNKPVWYHRVCIGWFYRIAVIFTDGYRISFLGILGFALCIILKAVVLWNVKGTAAQKNRTFARKVLFFYVYIIKRNSSVVLSGYIGYSGSFLKLLMQRVIK